jgi:F-type H+-transporting ATPase subunit a
LPQVGGTPQQNKPYIIVAQAEAGGHEETGTHEAVGHGEGGHGEGAPNPLAEHSSWYYSGVGLFVALIILVFVAVCRAGGLHKRLRSKGQALLEQGVASMNFFCRNAIGPGGERFTPLVATVFTFVLVSNLMGVLPTVFQKGHEAGSVLHVLPAPTANLSMTLALALVVFVVVQAVGIKENGLGGHLKHFAGPIPALSPLMFPLEIIGALAKPLSLSIRLFGNVFGEETVIAVLVGLAVLALPAFVPIPFQFPMLAFGVFGSLVQAGVFTILTCAYISLSLGDHDDHGHGAEHDDVKDEFGAHVPAH